VADADVTGANGAGWATACEGAPAAAMRASVPHLPQNGPGSNGDPHLMQKLAMKFLLLSEPKSSLGLDFIQSHHPAVDVVINVAVGTSGFQDRREPYPRSPFPTYLVAVPAGRVQTELFS